MMGLQEIFLMEDMTCTMMVIRYKFTLSNEILNNYFFANRFSLVILKTLICTDIRKSKQPNVSDCGLRRIYHVSRRS